MIKQEENTKKKLLMISYRFPWPEEKGGYNLRILNLAKILKKEYSLSLLTLVENKKEEKEIENLKKEKIFEDIIYFYQSKIQEYKNALAGIFSKLPLQVKYYFSKKMEKWLQKNYQNYDLLYFNTLRTAIYLHYPLSTIHYPPMVIDLIDSISLNYSEAKKWNKNLFWQLIYKIEIPRLKNFERKLIKSNHFKKIFISSEFDKKHLIKMPNAKCQMPNVVVIPNGVKEELFHLPPSTFYSPEKNWLSFFGKMDTQPNQDAAIFFAKEVMPLINTDKRLISADKLKFYIIGTNPTKRIKNLENLKDVKVTGYLKNPYEILEKSKVIVSPLRFGAGIQNKVLEAMALGKVVITSEVGARGISEAQPGKHFEVINSFTPRLWQEKIVEFLLHPEKREKMGREARKLIEENYRWSKIEERLLTEIRKIIQ
jgi:glycosyltransferase involved in cell wall biosynthesis